MKKLVKFIWLNLELFFWVFALVYLFLLSPMDTHFTLCPIKNMGFGFCPGCGLGHSIHYALWLDLKQSFLHHPLGIIAIFIIIRRIFKLFYINIIKPYQHGSKSFTSYPGR